MTVPFDVDRIPLSAAFYQSDPPSFYDGNSSCSLFERNTFVSAQM